MTWNKQDFKVSACYSLNAETTRIAVESKDSNTYLTRDIPGQHTEKEDETKIQMVLDLVATEMDPTNAIALTKEQLKETERALAESNDLVKKQQVVILNVTAEQSNLYDLIEHIYEHLGLELESGEEEEGEEDEGKETHDLKTESGATGDGSTTEDAGGDNHSEK